jgi:hypothetical protein
MMDKITLVSGGIYLTAGGDEIGPMMADRTFDVPAMIVLSGDGRGWAVDGGGVLGWEQNDNERIVAVVFEPDAPSVPAAPVDLAAENAALKADISTLSNRLAAAYRAKADCNDQANYERRRANDADAENAALKALVKEMDPLVATLVRYARVNDEMGRIVDGQTDVIRKLRDLIARAKEAL